MRALALATLIVSALGWSGPRPAAAVTLLADLSKHEIQITTGFTGAEVLLFGITEPDLDIIVIVRGPPRPTVVRKKERIAGIWINTRQMSFARAPSFYHVSASGDLAGREPAELLESHGLGLRYLEIAPAERVTDPTRAEEFADAFVRNKERLGLYSATADRVRIMGGALFRTTMRFPANVPTGAYKVDVHRVANGEVIDSATTPLLVHKAGAGATVYGFAHDYPAVYGVFAILIALMAGWIAGAMFRKV